MLIQHHGFRKRLFGQEVPEDDVITLREALLPRLPIDEVEPVAAEPPTPTDPTPDDHED